MLTNTIKAGEKQLMEEPWARPGPVCIAFWYSSFHKAALTNYAGSKYPTWRGCELSCRRSQGNLMRVMRGAECWHNHLIPRRRDPKKKLKITYLDFQEKYKQMPTIWGWIPRKKEKWALFVMYVSNISSKSPTPRKGNFFHPILKT